VSDSRLFRIQATRPDLAGAWLVRPRMFACDPPGMVRWTRLPGKAAVCASKACAEALAAECLVATPDIGHRIEAFDPRTGEPEKNP
jgi:hypothetical protein